MTSRRRPVAVLFAAALAFIGAVAALPEGDGGTPPAAVTSDTTTPSASLGRLVDQ